MKLNLGCGKDHKKGYINIDIQEPCDLKHDLRTPLPFSDNSVDEIFSEGFIWLLSRKEWWQLKKEVARVLKPNGKLEIIFLDFEYILKAFLDNKDGKRWSWWWQTIFSSQENDYEFSKNGFTYNKLVSDLKKEGMFNFIKIHTKKPEYIHLICHKGPFRKQVKPMKILIGTPIHEIKDYCMERWLKNVSKLQQKFPADILLVDNSPNYSYIKKVKGYCDKYKIKNYKIEHLELHPWVEPDERIARSREIIRQHLLKNNYDAWFSWENDQIIPPDTLTKLAKIMETGDYTIVHPNSWDRVLPSEPDISFGVCLINKKPLQKFGFILEFSLEPGTPKAWNHGDIWFKKRVLKSGGNYIEIYGLIKPIYHLDK